MDFGLSHFVTERIDRNALPDLQISDKRNLLVLSGDDFSVTFDREQGGLSKLVQNNKVVIEQALLPYLWRTPTDNDAGGGRRSFAGRWEQAGLDKNEVEPVSIELARLHPGQAIVYVTNRVKTSGEDIVYEGEYTVLGDGRIVVNNRFIVPEGTPPLARVGMRTVLPASFNQLEWYGKGPHESYIDRGESAFVGLYNGTVEEQHFPHVMPQENGNKMDVRWLSLSSGDQSVRFSGMPLINFNVQDYSAEALNESKTSHELKRGENTYLHIDFQQMGLGGDNSWQPRVHREYLLQQSEYEYSFSILAR